MIPIRNSDPAVDAAVATPLDPAAKPERILPGMAGIAWWMLILAAIGVFGVASGRFAAGSVRVTVLSISTLFAVAGFGLMKLRKWGWALTLAAAVLSVAFGVYNIFHGQRQWIPMSLANGIFFLYLVRPQVLSRLR